MCTVLALPAYQPSYSIGYYTPTLTNTLYKLSISLQEPPPPRRPISVLPKTHQTETENNYISVRNFVLSPFDERGIPLFLVRTAKYIDACEAIVGLRAGAKRFYFSNERRWEKDANVLRRR